MSYSLTFEDIAHEMNMLMSVFPHSKKDIGYGYRWTFPNGQRIDMIDYQKQGKHICRVGRGARLVRTYPLLYYRFDDVAKVIAKVEIHDIATLHKKNIADVLTLLYQAPSGIGVFD